MQDRAHRLHSPMIVYFDAIRKAGSIREAARRLHIASSAVNRQLLKLEAELGIALFERLPNGLRLTHAGASFSRHVTEVLQDAERARADLEALKGLRSGHIEIATVEGLTSDLLPQALADLRSQYPKITSGISVMGSQAIADALTSGLVDLGIAFRSRKDPNLQQIAHFDLDLGAVMRPDHPLAHEGAVSIAACLRHDCILPKPDLSINQMLMDAIGDIPRGAIEVSSVELAKQLTLQGLGLSFQTRIGIEQEIADGRLVHIPITRPHRLKSGLGIYIRSNRAPPIAVHTFAKLFSEAMASRADMNPDA